MWDGTSGWHGIQFMRQWFLHPKPSLTLSFPKQDIVTKVSTQQTAIYKAKHSGSPLSKPGQYLGVSLPLPLPLFLSQFGSVEQWLVTGPSWRPRKAGLQIPLPLWAWWPWSSHKSEGMILWRSNWRTEYNHWCLSVLFPLHIYICKLRWQRANAKVCLREALEGPLRLEETLITSNKEGPGAGASLSIQNSPTYWAPIFL